MKVKVHLAWEIFLLALTLVSLSFLVVDIFHINPINVTLTLWIDIVISLIFLTDFLVGLLFSTSRKIYVRENWLQLIASLPAFTNTIQALQSLRLLRALRLSQVLHGSKEMLAEEKRRDNKMHPFSILIFLLTLALLLLLLFKD